MEFYRTPPQQFNLNSAYRIVNSCNSCERFFPASINMNNNKYTGRSPCITPTHVVSSLTTPPTVIRRRLSTSSVSSMSSHSDTENIEKLCPLTTYRLKPITQRVRSMTMSITETGTVCLEFYKVKNDVVSTVEKFSVSQDGNLITITNLRQHKTIDENNRIQTFQLLDLPQSYHKKYNHARKFVTLVQSKTPKVTMYSKDAKCMLMENYPSPNFEAHFYSGRKVISNWSGMKLIDEKQGSILSLSTPRMQQQFSKEVQTLIKKAEKYQQQCLQFESLIQSTANSCTDKHDLFPVIMGKRPEMQSAVPEASSRPQPSNVSLITTTSTVSTDSSSSASTDTGSHVIRQVHVPGTGLASQLDNGDIWVEFEDGCHLGIKPTVTTVTYINQFGLMTKFKKSEPLPDNVKMKLASVPIVLQQLKKSQHPDAQ